MKIERRFTSPNEDAYSSIEFTKTTSEIRNPDGTVVFHLADLEVRRHGRRLHLMFWHRSISARRVCRLTPRL